ncbi:hypothetical protein VTL71DRAFT_3744 [Oculimacula yallundae]|uniref:Uncharacterized protein n=1 Tax=Oculimacula yallundae TaxID=86028 RepID=A0ABR4C518_9HELO
MPPFKRTRPPAPVARARVENPKLVTGVVSSASALRAARMAAINEARLVAALSSSAIVGSSQPNSEKQASELHTESALPTLANEVLQSSIDNTSSSLTHAEPTVSAPAQNSFQDFIDNSRSGSRNPPPSDFTSTPASDVESTVSAPANNSFQDFIDSARSSTTNAPSSTSSPESDAESTKSAPANDELQGSFYNTGSSLAHAEPTTPASANNSFQDFVNNARSSSTNAPTSTTTSTPTSQAKLTMSTPANNSFQEFIDSARSSRTKSPPSTSALVSHAEAIISTPAKNSLQDFMDNARSISTKSPASTSTPSHAESAMSIPSNGGLQASRHNADSTVAISTSSTSTIPPTSTPTPASAPPHTTPGLNRNLLKERIASEKAQRSSTVLQRNGNTPTSESKTEVPTTSGSAVADFTPALVARKIVKDDTTSINAGQSSPNLTNDASGSSLSKEMQAESHDNGPNKSITHPPISPAVLTTTPASQSSPQIAQDSVIAPAEETQIAIDQNVNNLANTPLQPPPSVKDQRSTHKYDTSSFQRLGDSIHARNVAAIPSKIGEQHLTETSQSIPDISAWPLRETDKQKVARLEAQVQECEAEHDDPIFRGTYKRRITNLTKELQRVRTKLDLHEHGTKDLRNTQDQISSSMSAVRKMLPFTPLPTKANEFIDRLGLKAMQLEADIKVMEQERRDKHASLVRNFDPEAHVPGVRNELYKLRGAVDRFEDENTYLRETMQKQLEVQREETYKLVTEIVAQEQQTAEFQALLEQKDRYIKRKDRETAQQAKQIEQLTKELDTARTEATHNANVASAAMTNYNGLLKLQTWLSICALFLFSVLPWGPKIVPFKDVKDAENIENIESVEDLEVIQSTSENWFIRTLKFCARNILLHHEETVPEVQLPSPVSTTSRIVLPVVAPAQTSTTSPVAASVQSSGAPTTTLQREKPTRSQDTQIRNKGKAVNKFEMSYGFPDHLPVDQSPVIKALRFLPSGRVIAVLQFLFVLLITFTMLNILPQSSTSNNSPLGRVTVASQFSGTSLHVPSLWDIKTGYEPLTTIDLGDSELWLRIEVMADNTFELEEDEPVDVVLTPEMIQHPDQTSEKNPVLSDSEPVLEGSTSWWKLAGRGVHVSILGVGLWKDLCFGTNR